MFIGIAANTVQSGGGAIWTPAALGPSLLGWWDAERSDLITQSGGLVSSWKDVVGGYDASQASGSLKPVYSATSFNSRPGITFDGADDYLRVASQPFPSGATPSEIWALVSQDAPDADTGTRRVVAYGGVATNNTTRFLVRGQATSTSVVVMQTGTGATAIPAGLTSATPFNGRHVVRGIVTGTTVQSEQEGTASSTAGAVSATATDEVRLGIGTNAAGPWLGVMSAVLVTSLLNADQAAQLYTYLKARGGIS